MGTTDLATTAGVRHISPSNRPSPNGMISDRTNWSKVFYPGDDSSDECRQQDEAHLTPHSSDL